MVLVSFPRPLKKPLWGQYRSQGCSTNGGFPAPELPESVGATTKGGLKVPLPARTFPRSPRLLESLRGGACDPRTA